MRQGIASLVALSEQIKVCWQAENGEQALTQLADNPVDVLLLDIRMPKLNGIDVVKKLRAQGNNQPVLMLTTFADSDLFMQSLQAGANGFLLKDVSLEKLVDAIKVIAKGGFMAEPVVLTEHTNQLGEVSEIEPLSAKETQILKLIAGGFSNKEIAASIFLAEGTVKNHVSNILSKLQTRDRTRAVLTAMQHQLI